MRAALLALGDMMKPQIPSDAELQASDDHADAAWDLQEAYEHLAKAIERHKLAVAAFEKAQQIIDGLGGKQ